MSDITSLFGGVSTNNNTTNTFSLADYASIRNGSYGKLLKSYYNKQDEEKKTAETEANNKQLVTVKSDADELKKTMSELMNKKLYEKNEKGEYDWDKITEAVKKFVDDYNAVIDKVGSSDDKSVLRNGVWMTGATKANADLLADLGITVGGDNKLTFKADDLKEAHMSTIKHMFTGANSFAADVLARASKISNVVEQTAGKTGSAYTSSGDYEKLFSEGLSYDFES